MAVKGVFKALKNTFFCPMNRKNFARHLRRAGPGPTKAVDGSASGDVYDGANIADNKGAPNDEAIFHGHVERIFSGLSGFAVCWLLGSFIGVIPSLWEDGKNFFLLYFSLFVFSVLFAPVYLLGRAALIGPARAFIPWSRRVLYCFLIGLAVLPALMVSDWVVGISAVDNMVRNGQLRLISLIAMTATVVFIVSATFYLLFLRIIAIFNVVSGTHK